MSDVELNLERNCRVSRALGVDAEMAKAIDEVVHEVQGLAEDATSVNNEAKLCRQKWEDAA